MTITKLPTDIKTLKDLNKIKGLIDERTTERDTHRKERSVATTKIKSYETELHILRKRAEELLGL